jgi:general stress protein 26
MGIRLSADEAWDVLASAHTGIFTSLRADGTPIALPVWFAAIDRTICFGSRSHSKKVARIRRNPRGSFLVESGTRWAELKGVHLTGRVEIVTDDALISRVRAEMDNKYASFRTPPAEMPPNTQEYYEAGNRVQLRFIPDERILTWDNSRIPLSQP